MVVIAPKALRGPGTVGVTRPADLAVPGTNYTFTALMDAADVADPTLVLQLRLLLDSRIVVDNQWACGAVNRDGSPRPPSLSYSCPETPPANYRVEVDLPRQVNIGVDVTLSAPSLSAALT